jgi:hypothetical protein
MFKWIKSSLEKVNETRARFVAQNLDTALTEVEYLETIQYEPLPMHGSINIRARRQAGFSEQDIQQIIEWRYVAPE